MTKRLHFHFSFSCIVEGNGNPLQCSCLENTRDGGARWASISGVAQSQTQLKRLSSSSSSMSIESVMPSNHLVLCCPLLLPPSIFPSLEKTLMLGKTEGEVAAAAAAKSLQSCPTLCDPIDGSPPGFPVPGILQARTLEWVAISFSVA